MDGENPLEGARAAPLLGQDTVEVLEGLGYTRDEIIRLRESGAI